MKNGKTSNSRFNFEQEMWFRNGLMTISIWTGISKWFTCSQSLSTTSCYVTSRQQRWARLFSQNWTERWVSPTFTNCHNLLSLSRSWPLEMMSRNKFSLLNLHNPLYPRPSSLKNLICLMLTILNWQDSMWQSELHSIFNLKLHLSKKQNRLTIREYDIYKLIEPVEFLNLAWSKEKLKHRAPHVIEMTHRFNILSNWAAVSIVTTESLKERKAKFAKAVNLAKECFKLNNFNSMKAILGGLENAAVHRLRFTKDDLVAAVTNELTQMINVTSQERSFKNLRSHILSCSPPLVPFLGVYCTDLTFIEDGNQDIVPSKKTGRNLINWTKRKLVFNVISEVQVCCCFFFPQFE